ncbi:prepilin peptidase [Patescibacteria group bacterium]|nr:prepilin peptidase [Patescibacteria group bacterium]
MLYSLFVFLFGLVIGSFLNCVIYRLALPSFSFWKNLGGSSRSYCPNCKHQLAWHDLIPVFSYLFLLGHCRYCKKRISVQYPLVELATGLLFLALFNADIIRNIYLFTIFSFLIIIFVFDLKHYLIPDKVIFPAIIISFLYNVFSLAVGNYSLAQFLNFFWAGLLPALFFFLLFFLSKGKWIGFGDVKLAILMGFFLGFNNVLVALFLAFLFGGIIGIGLIIFGKKTAKSEVPFGPFLVFGTLLALFFGENLINWYLNILVIK